MQIRVIGAHLPRLDQPGIAEFIAADVASFKRTLLDLIASGISRWTPEEVEERVLELPEELNADLQRCALFEVEVEGNDRVFDPSEFTNPETDQCGWEPVFYGLDGESIITEAYSVPPEIAEFRSAFYIHEWEEPGVLMGPTGVLVLPPFTPVPPRLWRLAPYRWVD